MEQLPQLFRKFEGMFNKSVAQVLRAYRLFCEINGNHLEKFELSEYFLRHGDDIAEFYTAGTNQLSAARVEELRKKKYEQYVYKEASDEWNIEVVVDNQEAPPNMDTLLYVRATREQLLNELSELQFFLFARQEEHRNRSERSSLMDTEFAKVELP